MKKTDVLACSFEKWYPNFKHLTIKSKLLKLEDQKFIAYLIGEGESTLRLPSSTSRDESRSKDEVDSSDSEDWDDDEEEDDASRGAPSFPQTEDQIKSFIKLLGGEVFPKLNWSAPRDAAWISCDKTLKCRFVEDVLLLVKSSDFTLRDLTQPFLHCVDASEIDERVDDVFLVLRQWRSDIVPNSEFRCFVKNSILVGICQRHDDAYFPFIASNEVPIRTDVEKFYDENVRGKFNLDNFVMDVYRKSRGEVLLLDFGPWGPVSDSLLFDWAELDNISVASHASAEDRDNASSAESTISASTAFPVFRYVLSDADMRPTRFASSAVPLDFHHLTTGEDPQKLFDFLNLQKIQNGEED